MRKSYEELNELKKKFNTDILWSWSRVNSVHNSLYEYFLKYVQKPKVKPDREDSIYTFSGSAGHDCMERYYGGEIQYEDMIEEFETSWEIFMMSELKFDRSDPVKNENIKEKYHANLQHFFTHHIPITTKILLEQFITIKIGDEYLNGYIDAITKDKNDIYHIIDWKSSSIYLGEKAQNECGQLVLYAIGLHQKGIPFDQIKICWDFMKYVNIYIEKPKYYKISWNTIKGEEKIKEKLEASKLVSTLKATIKAYAKADGMEKESIDKLVSTIEESNNLDKVPQNLLDNMKLVLEELQIDNPPRHIERCKIGESLQANVKSQMKKAGYEFDAISETLELLLQTNDLEVLPDDIRSLYRMEDCFVYVDLTEDLIQKWTDYITDTIKDIREKVDEYNLTQDESIWFESQEDVKRQSYYFSNLCSYSANIHKPYKMFLEARDAEKSGNILSNISGYGSEVYTSNSTCAQTQTSNDDDDLSWLDELGI